MPFSLDPVDYYRRMTGTGEDKDPESMAPKFESGTARGYGAEFGKDADGILSKFGGAVRGLLSSDAVNSLAGEAIERFESEAGMGADALGAIGQAEAARIGAEAQKSAASKGAKASKTNAIIGAVGGVGAAAVGALI